MKRRLTDTAVPTLRAWRIKRLMTQEALAKAADVAVGTVARAERGEPMMPLTVERLCRALHVTVKQLQEEPPE
jgi:transcriptional regulator with XRE-family HTH domain